MMLSRSEAHETLLFLLAGDGDLPAYMCKNFKEIIQGNYQKLKYAAVGAI